MNLKIEDEVEEVVDEIGDQLRKPAKAVEVGRVVNNFAVVGWGGRSEAGGFVYTSALTLAHELMYPWRSFVKLASFLHLPFKSPLHMLSFTPNDAGKNRIEINQRVVPYRAFVVVVDDVLSTGNTLERCRLDLRI